jgi:hypothetical protein
MEIWERPPLNAKTSTVDPLGGDDGDPGARATQCENVDGSPLGSMLEIRERPPLNVKTLMAGPMRGDDGDPGAPTIQRKNITDGPPGRRC